MIATAANPLGDNSSVVVLLEEAAKRFFPATGVNVAVLRAKDTPHPDSMRVHPVSVDKNLCVHCLACIKLCPSLSWDYSKAQVVVNEVSCKGCGICGSVCPAEAISQRQYSMGMVFDILDHLWEKGGEEREVESCSMCPVEALGMAGITPPESGGKRVRVFCSGRVEPLHVVESAQMGFGGVLLIDCFHSVKEKDRFENAKMRIERGARLLRTLGVSSVRIEAAKINGATARELPSVLKRFTEGNAHRHAEAGE